MATVLSMNRRVRREARRLAREARRGLRRHRDRLSPPVAQQMAEGVKAIDEACQRGDDGALRNQLVALDDLVDEHLSFARKSTAREYAESIAVAVLAALVLRAFVVEAFKIPSGSMIPTMEIGDHIFVNKFLYGVRIPFTEAKILQLRKPRRGEVIVFVFPCDRSKDFIKRIVAVEGDTVEVRCNQLFVNGKPAGQDLDENGCDYWDLDEKNHNFAKSDGYGEQLCPGAGRGQSWAQCRCSLYRESHGEYVYQTIYDPARPKLGDREGQRDFPRGHANWRPVTRNGETYLQPRCEAPDPGRSEVATRLAEGKMLREKRGTDACKQRQQFQVPPGHVFVMGDNRDHSSDSRIWGPVPLADIKGKALFIWWSARPSYAGGYQWDRVGQLVH